MDHELKNKLDVEYPVKLTIITAKGTTTMWRNLIFEVGREKKKDDGSSFSDYLNNKLIREFNANKFAGGKVVGGNQNIGFKTDADRTFFVLRFS